MKKLLLTQLLCVFAIFMSAQAPDSFKYQTVIRNNSGELIVNQDVSFRTSILMGSETGTLVYSETHAVTSNNYGSCSMEIGNGNNPSADFGLIDWGIGEYFIKIELDVNGGTSYQEMGVVQLLSVPYSLHSNSATSAKSIDNPILYFSDSDTLFAVRDREGNIVFAIYPDGAMVYVNETAKGKVGGFAVSGRSPSKGVEERYFSVTPDSTQIIINQQVGKGKVGGFAVSGRSPSKSINEDILLVTTDSTRVYVNEDQVKGKVGGFAVSGRSPSKSTVTNYMNLTKENYFIGHESGAFLTEGIYNSVLGYESGKNLTTGSSNAFLGYQSGYNTGSGSGNLFLGYQSGFSNVIGSYNTFMGYQAGEKNQDGENNTFLGSFVGKNNISGSYNTFIGDSAGYSNLSGDNNTFIGTKVGFNNNIGDANLFLGNFAGYSNEGGFENIFLGDHSGYSNVASSMNVAIGVRSGFSGESGWNNVYLGTETGYANIDGEGNVFIGYQTGMNNKNGTRNIFIGNRAGLDQQGSDKLIIDNKDEDSTSVFIWGDMLADHLRFNAHVGIGAQPGYYSLSVYESENPAILSLLGVGNTNDYAQVRLDADMITDTLGYQIIHDIDHRFRIIYDNGTNLIPRLGIDATGKVMIGDSWDDATEMLDVDGNARFRQVGTNPSAFDLGIDTDGKLTTQTSDKRLKTNIVPLNNSLEKVLKLTGYSFDWRADENAESDVGLIAQEVLEVFPQAVFTNPNDGFYGINYSRFPALFVEAFKEQNMKTEKQQKQIENLKIENQVLKQMILELKKEVDQLKVN